MSFSQLNLNPSLVSALPKQLTAATKIQAMAIPAVLSGKDVLALAQTGSGKTYAFGLPMLQAIELNKADETQALVIAPTRELANQVYQTLLALAKPLGIKMQLLCGGIDVEAQVADLKNKPQIIIATPARLVQFIKLEHVSLSALKLLVLDEADRLLDMGFWADIETIVQQTPVNKQILLFSATIDDTVAKQVSAILKHDLIRIEADKANSVVAQIEEQLYLVNKGSKAQALIALIKLHQWQQVLVFSNTKDSADALTKKLVKAGVNAAALHGDKEQAIRTKTLKDFKSKALTVLVATDVLARGIDIDALSVIINVDLPASAAVYVHRIGRTARAGANGLALSLVCHGESDELQAIRALTERALPTLALADFPVTDKPSSGNSQRPKKDKQANRRSQKKRSIKDFKAKKTPR
ncbi:DEAD/DEAH box helicase [Shewanella sp. UCD-KL21]|uniref:DEAD/DEAH box helicase n=1 Tax=Shewanella sp. UCD-KL21 TaxID=1917164 RepID=UPI0009713A5C|nr:DEAD/DEAH box helicase [Shewanella sp. UCD-KL21]